MKGVKLSLLKGGKVVDVFTYMKVDDTNRLMNFDFDQIFVEQQEYKTQQEAKEVYRIVDHALYYSKSQLQFTEPYQSKRLGAGRVRLVSDGMSAQVLDESLIEPYPSFDDPYKTLSELDIVLIRMALKQFDFDTRMQKPKPPQMEPENENAGRPAIETLNDIMQARLGALLKRLNIEPYNKWLSPQEIEEKKRLAESPLRTDEFFDTYVDKEKGMRFTPAYGSAVEDSEPRGLGAYAQAQETVSLAKDAEPEPMTQELSDQLTAKPETPVLKSDTDENRGVPASSKTASIMSNTSPRYKYPNKGRV